MWMMDTSRGRICTPASASAAAAPSAPPLVCRCRCSAASSSPAAAPAATHTAAAASCWLPAGGRAAAEGPTPAGAAKELRSSCAPPSSAASRPCLGHRPPAACCSAGSGRSCSGRPCSEAFLPSAAWPMADRVRAAAAASLSERLRAAGPSEAACSGGGSWWWLRSDWRRQAPSVSCDCNDCARDCSKDCLMAQCCWLRWDTSSCSCVESCADGTTAAPDASCTVSAVAASAVPVVGSDVSGLGSTGAASAAAGGSAALSGCFAGCPSSALP